MPDFEASHVGEPGPNELRALDPAPLEVEPYSPWTWPWLVARVKAFGPAAVAASVSIGAGETLIVVSTGGWARYSLLWLVALSCLIKGVFVTYLVGRYTGVTGEYLGHRMARLPGPRGWLLLLIIAVELLAAGPVVAVISRPCGNLIAHFAQAWLPGARTVEGALTPDAFAGWELAIAMTFVTAALGSSLLLSYQKLERENLIICGVLVGGTLLATLLIRPDLIATCLGTFVPSFPLTPWRDATGAPQPAGAGQYDLTYGLMLITAFGYVGNTGFGYVVYGNWVGLHGWGVTKEKEIGRIRAWAAARGNHDYLPLDATRVGRIFDRLRPMRWDIGMGAAVLFIVTAAFMVSGAQVLYPKIEADPSHLMPKWQELLTEQRHIWSELSPFLTPVYFVCVLAALWGTANTLPEIWARVTRDFLMSIWPGLERVKLARFHLVVAGWVWAVSMTCLAINLPLERLANVASVLTTNVGVTLVAAMALWANYRLPRPYRPGVLFGFFAILGTLILVLASAGGMLGIAQMVLWK